MATEAQRDLAALDNEIGLFKSRIRELESKRIDHPALLEISEEDRLQRLTNFVPKSLREEWKTLVDVEMSQKYIEPWTGYESSGGGYTEFRLILSFTDKRVFKFRTWENGKISMDGGDFDEFGWAPDNLDINNEYQNVKDLWFDALTGNHNKRKHICCAIATFIGYLYNWNSKPTLPWDVNQLLTNLNISD